MKQHAEPVWIDLATDDPDATAAFYGGVFAWTIEERDGYHLASVDGLPVASILDTREDGTGEPLADTAWAVALKVDNIDATARRVTDAGGSVEFEPMDIPGLGRMLHCVDTSGAYVVFWEDTGFSGLPEEPIAGAPAWFELLARDYPAARAFYEAVLGVTLDEETPGYARTSGFGIRNAGHLPIDEGSDWRFYLAVEDCAAACEQIVAAGGQVLDGPTLSPLGSVASIADNRGALLGLLQRE
ncbi:VOC family protein [Corynebacterium uterequi]|uniref:Lactoylglutathione lyase family protein n=1 Tax=Corynebacterium uterequi TaxID=1072256 RepID=A0A0G3HDY9_9CORY|nr:VOC family protein [Corynebacterium uterequi]AKK10138.1 lactoylglutathione lyase family protein [Corynebacterium uterequi]